jgi:plasmid stabilization system protein ParE
MFSVEYSERALRELEEVVLWYFVRSEKASIDFVKEFSRKIDLIKLNPLQFPKKHKLHREIILKTFPYSIVFVVGVKNKLILITAIFHHKRKPSKKFNK